MGVSWCGTSTRIGGMRASRAASSPVQRGAGRWGSPRAGRGSRGTTYGVIASQSHSGYHHVRMVDQAALERAQIQPATRL